jgi:hypothetical protein
MLTTTLAGATGNVIWRTLTEGRFEYGHRQGVTAEVARLKVTAETVSVDSNYPTGTLGVGGTLRSLAQACTVIRKEVLLYGAATGNILTQELSLPVAVDDSIAMALVLLSQIDTATLVPGSPSVASSWIDETIVHIAGVGEGPLCQYYGVRQPNTVMAAGGLYAHISDSPFNHEYFGFAPAGANPVASFFSKTKIMCTMWESKIYLPAAWCEYVGPYSLGSPDACNVSTIPGCLDRIRTMHAAGGTFVFSPIDTSNHWRTVGCSTTNGNDCVG